MAQKAKMKGNQGPKGQNERKSTPKRSKWGQNERKRKPKSVSLESFPSIFFIFANSKFLKRKNCKISRGNSNFGLDPSQVALLDSLQNQKHQKAKMKKKTSQKAKIQGMKAQKAKMKGNKGPKGQNERKNQGPKGQNERKRRSKSVSLETFPSILALQMANFWKGKIAKLKGEIAILGQILARWPFWIV